MSDVVRVFNLESAKAFNAKYCKSFGYHENVPEPAFEDFPGLERDPLGEEEARSNFAKAARNYQRTFGLLVDGKFGSGTWTDVLKRFDYVETGEDYVLFKGRRIKFKTQGLPFKHYSYDEKPGGIDLHTGGDFTSWKKLPDREIKKILFHWGGVDAGSCKNALFNRNLSSHYGLDLSVAFQWIDLGHRTWHAGSPGNRDTIGVDICQQPTLNHLERYLGKGFDVRKVLNPAFRLNGSRVGDKEIVTLDSRTAATARELAKVLCDLFEIPFVIPRNEDGSISHEVMTPQEFEDFRGVLWHTHVDMKHGWKWDVSPWAGQLFEDGWQYEEAA